MSHFFKNPVNNDALYSIIYHDHLHAVARLCSIVLDWLVGQIFICQSHEHSACVYLPPP